MQPLNAEITEILTEGGHSCFTAEAELHLPDSESNVGVINFHSAVIDHSILDVADPIAVLASMRANYTVGDFASTPQPDAQPSLQSSFSTSTLDCTIATGLTCLR